MCGIVGYSGFRQATEVLLEGLRNLEYRGYDSAGISVFEDGVIRTVKSQGRIQKLEEKLAFSPLTGTCGIAHTRWATHGVPSDINAHPHRSDHVSLLHNGIIENYLELKEELIAKGYHFASQTDTEVAAHLISSLYEGDPLQAISKALARIEGSYAFAILFDDHPDRVYGARKDCPLIAAVGQGENFILSDISATLKYTKDYYVLEDGDIVEISPEAIHIYDSSLSPVSRELSHAHWNVEQAQKGGFDHFMLKEIYEQPEAFSKTVVPHVKDGLPNFERDEIPEDFFENRRHIQIVACGTAMYAGTVGKNLIERFARIPVSVDVASEYRYNNPIVGPGDLVIVISQSGETADTLAALRLAKQKGADTLGVINVIGSSIAREADHVIYTHAGPEIAVASTKAFTVQMAVMFLLALELGLKNGMIQPDECRSLTDQLLDCRNSMEQALELTKTVPSIVEKAIDCPSLFYIGRGLDHALALEGSLKLKELSYLHSEAYAAGELKHGPISLITDGMPVIALATQQAVLPKTVSNMKEVKARGAKTLLICRESETVDADAYDFRIDLPEAADEFMPFTAAIAMQLIAYYKAVQSGCDVDKPRNLAKSVTVE